MSGSDSVLLLLAEFLRYQFHYSSKEVIKCNFIEVFGVINNDYENFIDQINFVNNLRVTTLGKKNVEGEKSPQNSLPHSFLRKTLTKTI